MNTKESQNKMPWILDGPRKSINLKLPRRLLDRFDQANPNRTAGIAKLMLESLGDDLSTKGNDSLPFRNPCQWPQKDLSLRNATILKIVETLQEGSMNPIHFGQLIRFGFHAEEELQNQEEDTQDAKPRRA